MHNAIPPAPSIPANDIAEARLREPGSWFVSRCQQLLGLADAALERGHLRDIDAEQVKAARQNLEFAIYRVPQLLKLGAFLLLPTEELEALIVMSMTAEGTIRNLSATLVPSKGQKIAAREEKGRPAQEGSKRKGKELREAVRDALLQLPKWREHFNSRVVRKILPDVRTATGRPTLTQDAVERHVSAIRKEPDSSRLSSDG
jgi:hypothetical protein